MLFILGKLNLFAQSIRYRCNILAQINKIAQITLICVIYEHSEFVYNRLYLLTTFLERFPSAKLKSIRRLSILDESLLKEDCESTELQKEYLKNIRYISGLIREFWYKILY